MRRKKLQGAQEICNVCKTLHTGACQRPTAPVKRFPLTHFPSESTIRATSPLRRATSHSSELLHIPEAKGPSPQKRTQSKNAGLADRVPRKGWWSNWSRDQFHA